MYSAPQLLISKLFLAKKSGHEVVIWLNVWSACAQRQLPPQESIRDRAALGAGMRLRAGPTCHAAALHSTADSAQDFLLRRTPENTCYCWQLVPQQQTDRQTRAPAFLPTQCIDLESPARE